MKQVPLIIACVLFTAAIVITLIPIHAAGRARVAFAAIEGDHDFGTTTPVIVSCDYSLQNGLPYAVECTGILKSCGCTTARIDKTRVEPGSSATLHCNFELRGKAGPFFSRISVLYRKAGTTDAPQAAMCLAHATVDPIVKLSKESIIFKPGESAVQTLSIVVADSRYSVTDVSVGNKAFTASLSSNNQLSLAFDPKLWGEYEGTQFLTITTNCPSERLIRVPITVSSRLIRYVSPSEH